MNPEVKRLWVEALRSGKYRQTKGMLRDTVGFCCLGVLCEVSGKPYTNEWDFLPSQVWVWAGLDCSDPDITLEDEVVSLSNLNDTGHTFTEIATLIERYL